MSLCSPSFGETSQNVRSTKPKVILITELCRSFLKQRAGKSFSVHRATVRQHTVTAVRLDIAGSPQACLCEAQATAALRCFLFLIEVSQLYGVDCT